MNWIGLLLRLVPLVLADQIDPEGIVDLFGGKIEKSADSWRIEPGSDYSEIGEVAIEFEELKPGHSVFESLEIEIALPWKTLPSILEESLGSEARLLPPDPATLALGAKHAPRPRTFAFDVEHQGHKGVVMVTGNPTDTNPVAEIAVFEILVRRLYNN